ncbi:MAG TPA: SURF1 family protein [Sphingomicrobium sp.]|jgi:cytochrome oxidase assembly protein ShyY1|nr:SURF1 family protein [Sphingomicrobium sp.]
MSRRLPLIPTIVVLAAVAVMIGLGVWQLRRAAEKEAMLQWFQAATGLPAVSWPSIILADDKLPLFRQSSGICLQPVGVKLIAGRNRTGESGYSHLVDCRTGAEGPGMRVDIGWSRDPRAGADWRGGPVKGTVAPDGEVRMRLVSANGLAGLAASAPPNTADIPNNHRSYAVQWFLFAGLALGIYLLAVRSKLLAPKP